MDNYQKVLGRIRIKIKPKKSEENQIRSLSQRALDIAKEKTKKYSAKAILAGSVTRNTWLSGKKEFDIFLLFPPELPENKLEEYGLLIGKQVVRELKGKFSVEYAQHPYASGMVNGIDIDIVPCYEVESAEKIKSAVDRTPFHVKYIEKNLPPELSDDVRLLKQFLTANKIYGADARTEGFSGYVCELLIINYGGFMEVINATSSWKPGEVIDRENHYKKDEHSQLRKKFKNGALIVIDPTDRNRNAASSLSVQNFMKLKKLAAEFIRKPSESLFSRKDISISTKEYRNLKKTRKTELILVKFKPPKVVPDILWPQLRRFSERLQNILEESKYEFKVLRRGEHTNEKDLAVVLMEMEAYRLPPVQKRVGPTVFDLTDSKRFLEKYRTPLTGPFVEGVNWAVEIERKFIDANEKLKDSLKKSAEILKSKGIPNYIADEVASGFEVIRDDNQIIKLMKKHKDFGVFLNDYFKKTI